jgi:Flp pilus assembly pilin Flp
MTKVLVATRRRNRRDQRGAATAEYAVATVAACGFGGILVALLKSPAVQELLKAIINFALRAAGLDGVQL